MLEEYYISILLIMDHILAFIVGVGIAHISRIKGGK